MASTDKTLANLSAWISLAALAGLVVIPLFFSHEDIPRVASPPPPPHAKPPGNGPAPAAPTPQGAQPAPPNATVAPSPKVEPGAPAPALAPPATTQQSSAPPATAPAAAAPAAPLEVWSDAEQVAGLRECIRQLAPFSMEVELEQPMRHGQCGTPAPLLLHGVGEAEKVVFDPAPEMNCRLAASVARFVETVLQPIAKEILKSRIVKIVGASSYACRNIYNSPNLPLSEHATGNAVDVVGFVTADGRTITVKHWWGPTERDIALAKKKAAETAAKAASKSDSKPETAAADSPLVASAGTTVEDAAKRAAIAREKANLHRAGLKPAAETHPPDSTGATVVASTTTEATFLKRLHHGSCSVFSTVLGPEANEAHRDHFHFDLAHRRSSAYCQ